VSENRSKRELGQCNAERLEAYLEAASRSNAIPMANGRPNRSKIAEALGFSRSVFQQNPAVAAIMERFEQGDRPDVAEVRKPGRRDPREVEKDRRIEQLEQRLASVQAENRDLKDRLRQSKWLLDELPTTGRLPW
jgi:hypothetical protein